MNSKTNSIFCINKINTQFNYNLIRSMTFNNGFCKNKFLYHLNVLLKVKCVNVKTQQKCKQIVSKV